MSDEMSIWVMNDDDGSIESISKRLPCPPGWRRLTNDEVAERRERELERTQEWFVSYMLDTYGRRDPECVWCGETVYMALQTTAGEMWTTEEEDEGPFGRIDGPGTRCSESPDGEHSCFVIGEPEEAPAT